MHLPVLLAQFPIRHSVADNLDRIGEALSRAEPGALVALPEGALSGYSDDLSFLGRLDPGEVEAGLDELAREAVRLGVHLWVGAVRREGGRWRNTAVGLTARGERHVYRKVHLAMHERGVFEPGEELPVFDLPTPRGEVRVGAQLCRDLRFPGQRERLARQGAQVLLHLNHARGAPHARRAWSSGLISRAVDNQRWVVSPNAAGPDQNCPSMAVAPDGEVRVEILSDETRAVRQELDLSRVSDRYLSQARTDLVGAGRAERGTRRDRRAHRSGVRHDRRGVRRADRADAPRAPGAGARLPGAGPAPR